MGLGSAIWNKPILDPGPGVKKAPDPGSGSATLRKMLISTVLCLLYDFLPVVRIRIHRIHIFLASQVRIRIR
jgi:hypothetical protein